MEVANLLISSYSKEWDRFQLITTHQLLNLTQAQGRNLQFNLIILKTNHLLHYRIIHSQYLIKLYHLATTLERKKADLFYQ